MVSAKSLDRRYNLLVNKKQRITATSSTSKDTTTYIEITTQTMYYSFECENSELFRATVSWRFRGSERTLEVDGLKSKSVSVPIKNTLEPLRLQVHSSHPRPQGHLYLFS